MRKALCGAAVVCVAIVGFASAAGAASQHQTAVQTRVATQSGAAAYLRSLGIDPASVVIQRGARNYAGPRCPGAGWNCTTSYRVFQISAGPGPNTYSCTPSGGGSQTPPNGCVIVQSNTTGNNVAACKLPGSTTGLTWNCTVTQTNSSGANRAEVKQEVAISDLATSSVDQDATVTQTNGSGANVVTVNQKSTESITDNSTPSVSWSQSADQDIGIDQNAVSGTNSVSATQELSQTQGAANATSGSQEQLADQQVSADQSSSGVSTLSVKQVESQSQTAGSGVIQSQIGPQGCCSEQVGNPANTAKVKQIATQDQEPGGAGDTQTETQTVTYSSSGNISGSQTTTQDGATSTNSFSGSTVSESQGCTDGTCTENPPPPPPAAWTLFQWTGGDGATATGSPFAVSSAESGPVVMSVTDAFCKGDTFTLSEGATTLGTTSTVPEAPTCPSGGNPGDTSDPGTAFNDPGYSHGTFALTAGAHSIGIVAANSPFGGGGAYYSVDPMTTAHCTGGRWATFTYPTFANEAACLAFVGA
jgi:hypothetical protein